MVVAERREQLNGVPLLLLFRVFFHMEGGEIAVKVWSYSSFNEEGCDVLSYSTFPPRQICIARKVGLELDLFSRKKNRVAEGGLFLEYGLLDKNSDKRSAVLIPIWPFFAKG